MSYGLVLIPVLTAFAGWFANWLLVKLLFHPAKPKKILGFHFQGIFPKKQGQIADKLGKLVSEELFSFAEIGQKATDPANFQKLMPLVEEHVDSFLREKLPKQMPMISMFIGDKTINELKKVFISELEALFPVIMKSYIDGLERDINLEKMVADKISGFSSEKLEQALKGAMSGELYKVGLLGAIAGFLIGLVQVFILFVS
jgi:uncharacterized membrane protein YheB (UPF0754 family)